MRHHIFIYFFIFFIISSLIGGSVFTTYSQFLQEGPSSERKEIIIPKGASLKKVSHLLKKSNLINSISIFELGVRASGNATNIQAGEFSIPPYASSKMIMNILTEGTTYIRKIVIPEGWTVHEIIDQINRAEGLEGEILSIPKEGTLLPETYHYSYGDTKQSILERMQNAMSRVLDSAWSQRHSDLPINNKEETLILASIIEKETSLGSERALVASVFMNRLKKRMRLQSDPTVIYGMTNGEGRFNRRLTFKELRTKTPYNTYIIYGLPPTPIANPSADSIYATLQPKETDYFYFVADGTGGHTFSTTYKDHKTNVQNWREVQRNRVQTFKKP